MPLDGNTLAPYGKGVIRQKRCWMCLGFRDLEPWCRQFTERGRALPTKLEMDLGHPGKVGDLARDLGGSFRRRMGKGYRHGSGNLEMKQM